MKKDKKESATQLDLGFKQPFSNSLSKVKGSIANSLTIFELMRYAKDGGIWIMHTISFAVLALQSYYIYYNYNNLPEKLPLVTFYSDDALKLYSRDFIILLPVLAFAILAVTFVFAYKWFNKERALVKIMVFSSTLSNILITLHVLKIIEMFK
ncbi:MAG: hypothetical protein UT34_C0002G0037 [candidate division WS6 bacterium GW2011_GWF2_39_15]|uniref:Uncharacterized protein n=1 Tax=candidate division WS6 bacterium GW2011_GWF2_39_15 TaxID=1619100 RepID=A0A0G0Q538_9BACT|nr:MAG: hypothetical protein UT34_C0002G0037 [candidate division WS6 bacterium GW2011_GWF2_39_15]